MNFESEACVTDKVHLHCLFKIKAKRLVFNHFPMESSLFESHVFVLSTAVIVVSSAKRNVSENLQTDGKSFMQIRNNNGPRIEPSLFDEVEIFTSTY